MVSKSVLKIVEHIIDIWNIVALMPLIDEQIHRDFTECIFKQENDSKPKNLGPGTPRDSASSGLQPSLFVVFLVIFLYPIT